jgi:hypothetical protein
MASKKALYTAAQCWCDPRVGDREMDSDLAEVFAEKLDDYIAALQWCGGSPDFNENGQGRPGWEKVVKPLLEEEEVKTRDGKRTIVQSEKATNVAAGCWCDPRMSDREMDFELATVFAEKIDDYIHALQWCGGSPDFNEGGRARLGWKKVVKPLLEVTNEDMD